MNDLEKGVKWNKKSCAIQELGVLSMELELNEIRSKIQYMDQLE